MNELMKSFERILARQSFLRQMSSTLFVWEIKKTLFRRFKIEKDKLIITTYGKTELDISAVEITTPNQLQDFLMLPRR